MKTLALFKVEGLRSGVLSVLLSAVNNITTLGDPLDGLPREPP